MTTYSANGSSMKCIYVTLHDIIISGVKFDYFNVIVSLVTNMPYILLGFDFYDCFKYSERTISGRILYGYDKSTYNKNISNIQPLDGNLFYTGLQEFMNE